MKRGVLVACVLLAIAGVAWKLFGHGEPTAATSTAAASAKGDSSRSATTDARVNRTGPAGASVGSIAPSPFPYRALARPHAEIPYWRERHELSAGEAYSQLAGSPDPAAWLSAQDLAMSCAWGADFIYEHTLRKIDAESKSESERQLRRQAAAAQNQRCKGLGADEINTGRRELGRRLAQSGDPHGIGEMGGDMRPQNRERLLALARQAAETREPLVMDSLATFFMERLDARFDSRQWEIADGQTVISAELRDAFLLAACDLGQDCGPTNPLVESRCINSGWCDSTTLEDSLTRHHADDVDPARVAAARETILQGLQTGEWPAGFWSGIRGK
jgi:hypothetical protein